MDISNTVKEHHSDGAMVFSCQYHVVFTTKYRRSVLDDTMAVELKRCVFEKQKEYGYEVLEMEVMPDHVHLLLDVNPKIGVYHVVSQIKGYTSKVLRDKFPSLVSKLPCLWTRSKFISTCGSVSLESVKRYIEDQKGK